MTHIEIQEDLLPLIGKKEQVLDGITGFVEHYDFSKANSSYEARVQAVTKVASICYGNPKSLGSINLFNRLEAEAAGLPSSSYEFVPILLDMQKSKSKYPGKLIPSIGLLHPKEARANCIKFGEYIEGTPYLLTNLRALIADVGSEESLKYLNTSDEEIQIIKDNFKVFLFNVDLPTRAQMVRHRVSWQELSRRYVSGKKQPFDFYISEKMSHVKAGLLDAAEYDEYTTHMLIEACTNHYNKALEIGIKPEEARRILPQAMMTTIWGAFQPNQLKNFFTLRLHKTAQREIQQTAQAMHDLIHAQKELV